MGRSSLLSLLLLAGILLVLTRTYRLWQEGPWDLPTAGKMSGSLAMAEQKKDTPRMPLANTKSIVEKNLFDPERGANRAEGEAASLAVQRIRRMVLLGTAILGQNRYAILQESPDARSGAKTAETGQVRIKLGDTVEGFKLSEVYYNRVVFSKGASKVEIPLDYFRKFEDTKDRAKTPAPVVPRIPARTPRREGAGQPPSSAVTE